MAENDPISSTGKIPNTLQFQNACTTLFINSVNSSSIGFILLSFQKQKKEMKRAEEKEAKRRKSLELKARATELVKAEAEAKKKQEEEAAAARSKMAPMTKEMWDKQQVSNPSSNIISILAFFKVLFHAMTLKHPSLNW